MSRKKNPNWFMEYAPKAEEVAFKKMKEGAASPRIQRLRQVVIEEQSRPKSLADMVQLLTPKEVAEYLRCSIDHVYSLVKERELISQPDQSRIIIAVTDLHDYLMRQRKKKYG